jgi:hypothetical protein
MATDIIADPQSKVEIRTHYCDFALDLPTNVTIVSAIATHTPPSGLAVVPTVVVQSPMVLVTLGPLTVLGEHLLSVLATLSDAEKTEIRLHLPVNW